MRVALAWQVSSSSQGVKPQVLTSATLEICASELVSAAFSHRAKSAD